MKNLKHLFTVLLLLCSTAVAAQRFNIGGIYYYIDDEINKTVKVTGEGGIYTGSVVIPDSVTYNDVTYSVTSIGSDAFRYCSRLTSLTIPNNVTSISDDAFNGCTSLKVLCIEDSQSELKLGSNGYKGLFSDCPLDSVYLGRNLYYKTIEFSSEGSYSIDPPFRGLTTLRTLSVGNKVTKIGEEFYLCTGLTAIHITDLTAWCNISFTRDTTYPYTCHNPLAYAKNLYLNGELVGDLIIPNNVAMIKVGAFYGCSLKSVTIGSSVLSIGDVAFGNTKIKKVIFLGNTPPSGVENARGTVNYVSSAANYGFGIEYTNLSSMFEVGGVKYVLVSAKDRTCDVIDCNYNSSVKNIVIDSLVTYRNIKLKVLNINDYALYDNDYINDAVIKNNGYIGSYAFYDCDNVADLILGNRIDSIAYYAFAESDLLKEIKIPDYTSYLGMCCFYNCISLKKAIIGSGVNKLRTKTFSFCSSLNEVKIGENVATIDTYAFQACTSLPQINIPQATKDISDYVFMGCENLSTVVIEDKEFPLFLGSNGSSPLFADCKLDSVYIGGKLQYNKTSSYGYSPFYANKYLRSVTYNDMEEAIYDREFMNCSNLQNIVFGKGITSIGVSAFKNCTSLPGITILDEVLTMGNSCFAGCTALKNAKVGTGVKTLEWYSFGACTALTDMQIGVNVDSIGKSVFYDCSSLPQINIPQGTSVINDSVFYNCTSLANVIIEDRKTTLNLGSNGSSNSSTATGSTNPLFYSCPLDSVYIGGKISYKTDAEYGFSPFFRNTSLRTVVVADNETQVYDNEFYGCTGLTDVVIGDGVTSIGNWAFSGCTGLVNFSFGSSVETIGAEAFSDCTSMVKIVSSCNVPPVCGDQALADINVWDCTLYVPNDYIDAYYNAEQWWDFFFIDGAEYTLLFMVDGEVYSESIMKYNSEITLPDDPVKKGHTFIGWGDVPAVMPAENITLNAEFSINNYTIKYIVDGKEYHSETIEYNTEIIPIEAPEKEGYEFNCWQALPLTMPDNDVEVVAVYDEIPTELIITIGQYGSTVYSSKYTLDFSNVEGLKAYAATGYNTNSGIITMTRVNTADSGTGLYLKGSPGQYSVPVIDYSDDNSLNMLVGNLEKSIVNALSNDGMYANYKYTIKSGDAAPMFYQYSDGSSISAGKAYLQIPTAWLGSQPSRSIGIRFDEGETTDIDKVKGENGKAKGIYDLKGYKIESVTTPGVYIIDGKKVYIK